MTLYTIIPALFFIVISERRNNRALVTYLLFSGLLAVISIPLVTMDFSADTVVRSLVFLPAGLVSGFVYWWFSGCHAGENIRELRKQIEVFD
ncbi:MAG: hypothetical protein JJ866_19015 [Roseibium sp.]|uniref:hypothetical protein n=1 Tax=Roseibium sp. TaxID=1936156 RepID=UPI001B2872BD|nr:hypothetical protein [Roseibium sp.]MBO6894039.1 hypothetical protein [Roseibium sp.]MBO6931420.1 hypothetical protein [Roseibium sp.]